MRAARARACRVVAIPGLGWLGQGCEAVGMRRAYESGRAWACLVMALASVHCEGALGLGTAPDVLESEAHELGPRSLEALGLLGASRSNGSLHDGRAVKEPATANGPAAASLARRSRRATSRERAARKPAVGLTRSLRMSRIAAAGHVYVIETRRSLRTPQPTPFTTCRVDAWSLGYQEGSAQGQGVVRDLTHPLTSASHQPNLPSWKWRSRKGPFQWALLQ
jgi:hypothetical protein